MKVIETNALCKSYGGNRGVNDIDISVLEGEAYGFVGPNGAGKSTLIRTLLNLIFPTGGSATLLGMDIIKDTHKIKAQVGYLPGDVYFYDNMTVSELLRFGGSFYPSVDGQFRDHLCDRLSLDVTRNLNDLSLGNKKKVGIVMAMMHRPKLLIMDEPTNGLDPLMQIEFHKLVAETVAEGTSLFLSSHRLEEVERICSKVSVIKEGRMVGTESMKDLMSKQFKNVSVLSDGLNLEQLSTLTKAIDITQNEGRINFKFQGDMNEVMTLLNAKHVEDLTITNPTLEEVFLHYYE